MCEVIELRARLISTAKRRVPEGERARRREKVGKEESLLALLMPNSPEPERFQKVSRWKNADTLSNRSLVLSLDCNRARVTIPSVDFRHIVPSTRFMRNKLGALHSQQCMIEERKSLDVCDYHAHRVSEREALVWTR